MKPKVTINIRPATFRDLSTKDYCVVSATNTVNYAVGQALSKQEVESLIAEGVTVNLKAGS